MPGLCFLGDVMLGRDVAESTRPEALRAALEAAREGLPLVVNLECSAPGAAPASRLVHSAFAARADLLAELPRAGVVAVHVANNHALDFGSEGLRATTAALENLGLGIVGLRDPSGAPRVWTTRVAGYPVHVVGGCALCLPARYWEAGLADARRPEYLSTVRALSERGERVIASVHWGHERIAVPPPAVRDLARRLADAGATLVVGHGPHVVQGWERRGPVPLYYSLGDAVFDRAGVPGRDWGLALHVDAAGATRVVPFDIDPESHLPRPPRAPSERHASLRELCGWLADDAAWERRYFEHAGQGFVAEQWRTTLRLVRKGGLRGLAEKLRGLRPRHLRLLFHATTRLGR